ncbi:hypothetical protein QL285_031230 [Trifolium repens]|nr:hypothetical protein QL285_031230 [Trifolium repens]
MELATEKKMHLVGIGSTHQSLEAFLQPCNIKLAQPQDPSHSDVNSVFSKKLPGAAHYHASCTDDHSPHSSASGITCPPASAWFVPEPHRTGRGLFSVAHSIRIPQLSVLDLEWSLDG